MLSVSRTIANDASSLFPMLESAKATLSQRLSGRGEHVSVGMLQAKGYQCMNVVEGRSAMRKNEFSSSCTMQVFFTLLSSRISRASERR